jgi:MFS family permease
MSDETTTARLGLWQFLQQNANFRKLLFAQATSELGSWFNSIALMAFVYARTESGLMVSLALLADAVPSLLLSPFSGVIADRFDKRKIMIATDLIRAVLALLFLFVDRYFWSLFLIKFLLSANNSFFKPARQASTHHVVRSENLIRANSLSSMVWGSMSIIGASLGGILSAAIGYQMAFVLNSLSFLVSAYYISQIKIEIPTIATPVRNIWRDIVEGYHFMLRTPMVYSMIFMGMAWGFVGGAYMVLLPIYGAGVYHQGDFGIGILYAVQGAGVLIGGLLVGKLAQGKIQRMKTIYGWSYLFQGLFFVIFALTDTLVVGSIVLLLMRITGGLIIPLDSTLLQHYTPKAMQGRVFSLQMAIFSVVLQSSMLTIGVLLKYFSPQTLGVSFGLVCIVISVPWLIAFYTKRI